MMDECLEYSSSVSPSDCVEKNETKPTIPFKKNKQTSGLKWMNTLGT